MSLRRSTALAGHELRLMRHDLAGLSGLVLLPLVMVAFLNPLFGAALEAEGVPVTNGASAAVPGMAVLFALFLVQHVGYLFFREHHFGTWERLRATPLSPTEVIAGKTVPAAGLAVVQQVLLFVLSIWLFDLHISGSVIALGAVVAGLSICLVACGVAAVAYVRNSQRFNAMGSLVVMLVGGLGGGLAPVESLPTWAQRVAPFTPGYWAVRGYRSVIQDGGGLADVAFPVGVLVAFTVVATALAAVRFRFEETKVGFE